MAQGRKTGGRDWRPGESGNPNGRPRANTAVRTALREFLNGRHQRRGRLQVLLDQLYTTALEDGALALRLLGLAVEVERQAQLDDVEARLTQLEELAGEQIAGRR